MKPGTVSSNCPGGTLVRAESLGLTRLRRLRLRSTKEAEAFGIDRDFLQLLRSPGYGVWTVNAQGVRIIRSVGGLCRAIDKLRSHNSDSEGQTRAADGWFHCLDVQVEPELAPFSNSRPDYARERLEQCPGSAGRGL